MGLLDDFSLGPLGLMGLSILGNAYGPNSRNAIGQGALQGLLMNQQMQESAQMKKLRDFQIKQGEQQMADVESAKDWMKNFSNPVAQFAKQNGSLAPTQENAQAFADRPPSPPGDLRSMATAMALSGNPVLMKQAENMKALLPKVKDYNKVMVGGQAVYQPMFEDGTMGAPGAAPAAERLAFQNLGGQTVALDPFSGKQVAGFKNTLSPDAAASNALGWANNAVSRQRLAFDQNQALKPQFHDGQWVMPPTASNPQGAAMPVQGYQKPLGEAQKKQLTGIDSLNGAINDYLSELQNWSNGKALTTSGRASMGTKYNNMMLQAKEAYNLGVLNGPDYEILQSVVTNPMGVTGMFTSNEALGNQAKELRRMMEGTASAVRNGGIPRQATSGGAKFLGFE